MARPKKEQVELKKESVLEELKRAGRTIICHQIDRWGGIKCEDHSLKIIISVFLIMLISVGGALGAGFHYLPRTFEFITNKLISRDSQLASTAVSLRNHASLKSSVVATSTESKGCDLHSGKWELWLGDMSKDIRDQEYIYLPNESSQGLFKYHGHINDIQLCEFIFIPRGDNAMNYVVSFDGAYQVVVGDNDYWTISLRATDSVETDLEPIQEKSTGKTRPRLLHDVKKGSVVRMQIRQGLNSDKKYEITALITYTPEIKGVESTRSDTLTWVFPVPPIFALSSPELSIGLIRAKGDTSDIGATFVYPNPEPASKNEEANN